MADTFRWRYSDGNTYTDYGTRAEAETARDVRNVGIVRKMKVCPACAGSHELGQSCGCNDYSNT